MKVAIATFGDRVSPRFDCANAFRLVTLDGQAVVEHSDVDATHWGPQERIKQLLDQDVEVVVCGGIDRWSADSLTQAGITLHGWVSGSIDESLELLRRGDLPVALPLVDASGCGARRGRRRGRCRGGPQRPGPGDG